MSTLASVSTIVNRRGLAASSLDSLKRRLDSPVILRPPTPGSPSASREESIEVSDGERNGGSDGGDNGGEGVPAVQGEVHTIRQHAAVLQVPPLLLRLPPPRTRRGTMSSRTMTRRTPPSSTTGAALRTPTPPAAPSDSTSPKMTPTTTSTLACSSKTNPVSYYFVQSVKQPPGLCVERNQGSD